MSGLAAVAHQEAAVEADARLVADAIAQLGGMQRVKSRNDGLGDACWRPDRHIRGRRPTQSRSRPARRRGYGWRRSGRATPGILVAAVMACRALAVASSLMKMESIPTRATAAMSFLNDHGHSLERVVNLVQPPGLHAAGRLRPEFRCNIRFGEANVQHVCRAPLQGLVATHSTSAAARFDPTCDPILANRMSPNKERVVPTAILCFLVSASVGYDCSRTDCRGGCLPRQ